MAEWNSERGLVSVDDLRNGSRIKNDLDFLQALYLSVEWDHAQRREAANRGNRSPDKIDVPYRALSQGEWQHIRDMMARGQIDPQHYRRFKEQALERNRKLVWVQDTGLLTQANRLYQNLPVRPEAG